MNYSFEEALGKLEEISKQLQENKLSLNESLDLYAEGVKLIDFCNKTLNEASLKITEIQSGDSNGQ